MGVIVLDNEYKDTKINRNTIRIGRMYNYAFWLNGNDDVYKNIMEDGIYNFLTEFQNTDNYKIMMTYRLDSFIFGNVSKVWDIDLVVSRHTYGR